MSGDGTSDKIVSEYGSENVFRFNFEMWKAYKVSYSPDYWSITNPVGHTITSESATVAFWWKTFTSAPPLDKHTLAEIKYFLKDLYGWFISRGLAKGNAPDFHNKFGKLNILSFAKEYFAIPPTLFSIGLKPSVELEGKKLLRFPRLKALILSSPGFFKKKSIAIGMSLYFSVVKGSFLSKGVDLSLKG